MKRIVAAALLCMSMLGMDDSAVRAVDALESAERVVGQAEERIERLQRSWLVQWISKKVQDVQGVATDFLHTGNEDPEVLDREFISSLESRERDHDLTEQQRAEARDVRLQIEQDAYTRNRRWLGMVNSVKGQMIGLQMKAATFLAGELAASTEHQRKLEELGVQGAADKEARVAVAKEYIQAIKDNPGKMIAAVAALSIIIPAGIYLSKHGIESIFEYYKMPELADPGMSSISQGWLGKWFGKKQEVSLSDVILEPVVAERIRETVHGLKNTAAHGSYLKNILLYGEPGVGKTMVALRMARGSGFDYIYFAASNLVAFSEEVAVQKLRQLFNFARSSSGKLVIVIDEIELLAGDRSNPQMSDKMKVLLNLILANTSGQSHDFMIIGLTNRKQDLDPAFLSRCNDRIHIEKPGSVERRALVQLYVDKYLHRAENLIPKKPSMFGFAYWFGQASAIEKPRIEEGALSQIELDKLSERLKGFVGRDVAKLMSQVQSSALASDANMVTRALIHKIVAQKVAEIETDKETLAMHHKS